MARHGRTAWNAAGRYQGHADIPLDSTGEGQADELARALAPLEPVLVVSSDLQRARCTAAALAARAGIELRVDPRLREVDVGAWEGLTPEEAETRFPTEYAAWRAGEDVPRGGGETRRQAGTRAAAALLEHARAVGPGDRLVAVSHGMVLRAAVRSLRAGGWTDLAEDPPHLGNVGWMEMSVLL